MFVCKGKGIRFIILYHNCLPLFSKLPKPEGVTQGYLARVLCKAFLGL